MFCQSCGARNTDDAKFCNQCGSKIARVGEAGGPLPASTVPQQQPPAAAAQPQAKARNHPGETAVGVGMPAAASAPDPTAGLSGVKPNAYHPDTGFGGQSMLGVSLAGIGVRSSKRTWATILFIAVALVALGAFGMWLARGEPEVVAEAGHAEPNDPFVIGTPLPEGDDGPDFVSGSDSDPLSGVTMSAMSSNGTMSSATSNASSAMESASAMETSSPMGTTSAMETTSAMGTSTNTSSMTTAMETSMTATMETATMETTTMETTTINTNGSNDVGEEIPEDRDLEMELYSSRVRFVIRRYYAARAQACFDRATRNQPTISGTVVVNMSINAEGAVTRSSIARNTTGDSSLGNCLENQVSTWRLPPPPGGGLDMQMPFSR